MWTVYILWRIGSACRALTSILLILVVYMSGVPTTATAALMYVPRMPPGLPAPSHTPPLQAISAAYCGQPEGENTPSQVQTLPAAQASLQQHVTAPHPPFITQSVEKGAVKAGLNSPNKGDMAWKEAELQRPANVASGSASPFATRLGPRSEEVDSDSSGLKNAQGRHDPKSLCIVCWERKPSWICVPCGHLAMCKSCSQAVKKKTNICPVCQQAIRALHQVYLT